jgi:hypothetical protein
MDNDARPSLVSQTDTVEVGDRGSVGIALWLVAALIVVVAASQFGPLKRYLTASPQTAHMPEAEAPIIDAPAIDAPRPASPAQAARPAPPAPPSPPAATIVVPLPSTPVAPQIASPAVEAQAAEDMPLPMPQAAPAEPKPSLPAGHAGLVEAIRKGLLRPASGGDLAIWKSRWSQTNGRGLPQSFDDGTRMMSAYVIQGDLEIPAGLSGAHAVVFVLEKNVAYPRGNPGHSIVLDQTTGACMGAICGMLLDQD